MFGAEPARLTVDVKASGCNDTKGEILPVEEVPFSSPEQPARLKVKAADTAKTPKIGFIIDICV